jgi:transcriptional regulator with XRE-family HTH domain
MNHYEPGTRNPSFQTAVKIAEILGVPPLFFYEPRDALAEVILFLGQKDDTELEEIIAGS